MITSAIPVIAVSDSARAEDYYCRVLGFQKMSAYPPDATKPDPRYLGLARDGVWLHLQSYKPQRAGMTETVFQRPTRASRIAWALLVLFILLILLGLLAQLSGVGE